VVGRRKGWKKAGLETRDSRGSADECKKKLRGSSQMPCPSFDGMRARKATGGEERRGAVAS